MKFIKIVIFMWDKFIAKKIKNISKNQVVLKKRLK